jgi:hypothetical protein
VEQFPAGNDMKARTIAGPDLHAACHRATGPLEEVDAVPGIKQQPGHLVANPGRFRPIGVRHQQEV